MSFYYTQPRSRSQIALTAQGLLTESWPRQAVDLTSIMIDGTIYFMAVGLRAGDSVSNIALTVRAAGVAATLSKVGLYSKAGARLALSADQGAGWESIGTKNIAMATPYVVPTDDGYYIAVVCKATTLPTLARGTASAFAGGVIGSGMGVIGIQTGQTDLPASATIAVGSGSPLAYWVGVS